MPIDAPENSGNKKSSKLLFPAGFLWGVATSAYQIEGKNSNADWWSWEQQGKTRESSGNACAYWDFWKKDHELLSELGANSFRLSLEWSRIEPSEGQFSAAAIRDYREILQDLKKRNIKTIVTFWHWTSPIWFAEKYGLHKKESVEKFLRYGEKIMDELGDLIDIVVTINEPMVPLGMGFLTGKFPPGFKNPYRFFRAAKNLAQIHKGLYKSIHAKRNIPVGITYLYNYYFSAGNNILEKIANSAAKWFRVNFFSRKIKGFEDYVGIDYYRLVRMKFDPKNSNYFGFRIEEDKNNVMGWISYPEGIYRVLMEVSKESKLPIYIMENGRPTNAGLEDAERTEFLNSHLAYVGKAIQEGADVRGYLHWSLLDNYEWLEGFRPRFGLVEIDYQTLERKPRKSFYAYKKIIENNGLE
ncbi:MAG: glycoside hydrolase family 1 protein [Candidatus Moranbacteria bacterium CG_4_9_14_3_um_filter_42_9]|nr:MAG: glycoside hydrolase family 1 protein [Candidatus Moranbacteria bacterium CG_4_9_14_3_um_filter_42_9]